MKESVRTDNAKWQAVVACDKSYDGIFFYGVNTTGIFCRPSCRAKTPIRKNVVFFNTLDNAITAGFRPCKKCRPDLIKYEPGAELVSTAQNIFNQNYDQLIEIEQVARQLGVSVSHLVRLFKQHIGLTPAQYLSRLRVNNAVKLLEQTDINIIEIAYTTGFKSVSNFYKCFTNQLGHPPSKYRKLR